MTWVRLDDRFYMHPKFVAASDEAVALWVRAIAYCNNYETDGEIPSAAIAILSRAKRPKQVAAELVSLGLWESHEKGWTVHDYGTYQPLKAQLEAERRSKRQRQQKWRENSSGRFGDTSQDGDEHDSETPKRPVGDGHVDASTSSLETRRETVNKRCRNDRPVPVPDPRRDLTETPPPQLPPETRAPTPAGGGGRAALPGFGSDPELTPDAVLDELRRHPQLNHVVTGATHAPKTLAELARSNGVTLAQLVESVGYVASITPDGEAVSATLGRLRGAVMAVHKRTVGQRQRNRDEARPLATDPPALPKLPAGTGRLPPPMPLPERVVQPRFHGAATSPGQSAPNPAPDDHADAGNPSTPGRALRVPPTAISDLLANMPRPSGEP